MMLDDPLFKTLYTQISVLAKLVELYEVTAANVISISRDLNTLNSWIGLIVTP